EPPPAHRIKHAVKTGVGHIRTAGRMIAEDAKEPVKWALRRLLRDLLQILATRDGPVFYVYENWTADGHRACIHVSSCSYCNDGRGIHPESSDEHGGWSDRTMMRMPPSPPPSAQAAFRGSARSASTQLRGRIRNRRASDPRSRCRALSF